MYLKEEKKTIETPEITETSKNEAEFVTVENRQTEQKRKKGRPRLKKEPEEQPIRQSSKKGSSSNIDQEQLEKNIKVFHSFIAVVLKEPHWIISEEEARSMATALIGFCNHYQVKLATGAVVWFQLISAFAVTWVPRIALTVSNRSQKEQVRDNLDNIDGIPIV